MLFLDVNICLHGLFPDASPAARSVAAWLGEALNGSERVGVSDQVLSSMIRIGTNRKLYPQPSSTDSAVSFAETLRSAPTAVHVRPGSRHWGLFAELVRDQGLRASDVADAYLAAIALEQGATFVSRDRGFRRFQDRLRVLDPLDP